MQNNNAYSVNATAAAPERIDCMQIKPVAEVLDSEGLGAPTLNALVPNESNYTVLLMQPHGHIDASSAGVRNRDRHLALRQFGQFLADARQTQADLAITPEYSMPWETLVSAIKENTVPVQGKLWALGCESIKYSNLETLKYDLAPFATVLCEPLQPDPGRFTDPLAYVFLAPIAGNATQLKTVILIQFKTCTMGGDVDHFEVNGLQLGSLVYQFGSNAQSLRLVSLICSDVFDFDEENHARAIYHQSLIIHIQLNRDPRQAQYRRYRDRLFGYAGDVTEVLCLNWAQDVEVWKHGGKEDWKNIAGSAWYLRPDRFDARDETLCSNHRRGLYYTWLENSHAHALFFNYQAAVFQAIASKVAHVGVLGPKSYRRGPQLDKTFVWSNEKSAWVEQVVAEDGFYIVACESGHAKDEIKRIADGNPLEAERVLALCAGKIGHGDDWHAVHRLDSCVIDASEVIRRITFCQDTDEHACQFRVARLKRCGHLWDILKSSDRLPPALADLKDGFRLEWSPAFPHQNAISATGQRATLIYMGEDVNHTQIEATAKRVAEYLHRRFTDSKESLSAKQRIAIWFRENNEIALWDPNRYVKIDQTGDTSEFDIGREK
jgi:hypothetical protein